jgi:hypothetical protein
MTLPQRILVSQLDRFAVARSVDNGFALWDYRLTKYVGWFGSAWFAFDEKWRLAGLLRRQIVEATT